MQALMVAVVLEQDESREAVARAFDGAPAHWNVSLHREPPEGADVVVARMDTIPPPDVALDPDDLGGLIGAVSAAARRKEGRVVGIIGAGGGTGVTTVALHLAAASRGDVCVVDLDTRWQGAAGRLGVDGDGPTWADVDEAESVLRFAIPVTGGFRLLRAPASDDPIDPGPLIERIRGHFDRVVVDGAMCDLHAVLAACDVGVLVATPSLPSMTRAASIVSRFDELPWAVVTNRLGPGSDATRARLESELGRSIALQLPCCAFLRDSEDIGTLVAGRLARWPRKIARLATALGVA